MVDQDLASALMGAAVDAIIVIDDRGVILRFSKSAESLFGYNASEVIGKNVSLLMPEPDASFHDSYIEEYKKTGTPRIIGIGRDVRGRRKNSETFPMHLSVGESSWNDHRMFVGICHDLTSYHDAMAKLADAEQRYRDIVQSQRQFICRLDKDFRITFANASFIRAVGAEPKEMIGAPITVFTSESDRSLQKQLARLFESNESPDEISVKITMHGKDGSRPLVDWSFRKTQSPDGNESELQGLGIDISDQERALQQAHYLHTHDPLTGFLNKQTLVRDCENWFSKAGSGAFLMLDCEHFSLINQRFGSEIGDAVLIEIANRIKQATKRSNRCARADNDRFLIAIRKCNRSEAHSIAERINSALEEPVHVNGDQLNVRATIGIAMYPSDSGLISALPEFAESAKGAARRRNHRIGVFDSAHHRGLVRQIEIEQSLKAAIENRELEIYLQPKYHVENLTIDGFEALVRWFHPKEGFISPGEFVPIAEKTSLGLELDRYVLNETCRIISEARDTFASIPPIAINITAAHFSQQGFSDTVLSALAEARLSNVCVELEITEGALIEQSQAASENLRALRQAGIRLAIDDFGTGYSSLTYLRYLAIDDLKIDKTFIDEIMTESGWVIVRAIIDIANAHDILVVAEGVETAEQLAELRGMGCHLCQGYLLSRPLPAFEAFSLLKG